MGKDLELGPQPDLVVTVDDRAVPHNQDTEKSAAPRLRQNIGYSGRTEHLSGEVFINVTDTWMLPQKRVALVVVARNDGSLPVQARGGRFSSEVAGLAPIDRLNGERGCQERVVPCFPVVGVGVG